MSVKTQDPKHKTQDTGHGTRGTANSARGPSNGPRLLIGPSKRHRTLYALELIRRREALGISQAQLADILSEKIGRLSVSQVYIAQLESLYDGEEHEIPTETAEALQAIFNSQF